MLSKATEYIAHLEKRNRGLARENRELRGRVDAFELLVMARQGGMGGGMGMGMGGGGMGNGGMSVMQGRQQQMALQQQQLRGFGGLEGMSGVM